MQTEETYDDLTAQFEAQDDALQSDLFVANVMQPIGKRSRWRAPLLFGAGGLGIGAAISQMGGLFEAIQARTAMLSLTVGELQSPSLEAAAMDPLWIGAALMIVISCAAIIVTERA